MDFANDMEWSVSVGCNVLDEKNIEVTIYGRIRETVGWWFVERLLKEAIVFQSVLMVSLKPTIP